MGGIVSGFFAPGPRLQSSIQHFAAGLVFAAVATGLLPEMLGAHNLAAVIAGFSAGVVLMLGVKWFSERKRLRRIDQADSPHNLVFTAGVDYLMDGC
jgi:ZIP family zinc transporter